MKEYNVNYEMASVCILVLMLALVRIKGHLNIFKNKCFAAGLSVMLALDIADILCVQLINNGNVIMGREMPLFVSYISSILVYILQQMAVMLFLVYITVEMNINWHMKLLYGITGLISLAYCGLVLSTPITKLVFYYTGKGEFHYGDFHDILWKVPAVIGLSIFLIMLFKKNNISVMEKNTVVFFCGTTLIVAIVQVSMYPQCLMVYFWVTIALTVVFLTLQSPDYYLDRTTSAFNSDGLDVMIRDQVERQKQFSILLMSVHDFEGIKDGFSTRNKKIVYSKICAELMRPQGKKLKKGRVKQEFLKLQEKKKHSMDIFRDDDKIYVMFHDITMAEKQAMAIGSWVTDGIKLEGQDSLVKLTAKMLLFDFPGDIHSEDEFNSVVKYFDTDDFYNRYNEMYSINEEFFRKKKRYEHVRNLVEEAIRTEGIEMYYQPIYSSEKKDFHSAEALVRMRDPEDNGKFVSPELFIPIAEKEHLILQLEEVILRKIFKFIRDAKLKDLGMEYIEVNLSGNQCIQPNLYVQLEDLLEEYNIPPKFVNFEVTETSAIMDREKLSRNMEELKRFGSTFALDDYGTGASNLQYLVDYPFEIVKLDKSIVWAHYRESDPKTRPVLPQSVKMLREMNVRIVAEGVEYEEEMKGLIGMGVQYLQGYFFSKPIPEGEFIRFLKKHNFKV